jgi:hypothetical protein
MASDGRQSRVILDPSVIFSEEALGWIADPELSPLLVVSRALVARLQDGTGGEQFLPYANPNPQQIERVRNALAAREIAVFSFNEAAEQGVLPDGAREICERLLEGDEPLGDVLADEWAFLTTQSLAVLRERAKHAIDAFRRAGAQVIEVASDAMRDALSTIRQHIPAPVLDAMKRLDPLAQEFPKWLLLGGEIAGYIIPPLGLSLLIAKGVKEGVVAIAGDP